MPLLDEIASRLDDQNLASTSSGADFFLVKAIMPDTTAAGDRVVALFETGGGPPSPRPVYHQPTFQVRVRGDAMDATSGAYPAARSQIEKIWLDLNGLGNLSLSGTHYAGIWAEQSPFLLRYDDNQRPELVCNFRAIRTTT